MVYNIFVRKKNGQVINEIYKTKKKAIERFDELADRFPEVYLGKKRYRKDYQGGDWIE